MAIDQKLQPKELVAQSNIRTMKKDLKRLREADIVKESQRIMDTSGGAGDPETQKQKAFLLQKQQGELKQQLQVAAEAKVHAQEKAVAAKKEKNRLESSLPKNPTPETARRWQAEKDAANVAKKAEEIRQRSIEAQKKEESLKAKIAETKSALNQVQQASPVPKPARPPITPITEQEKKRKFMEDVETWANSNK